MKFNKRHSGFLIICCKNTLEMITLIVRRTACSFYVSKTFQLLGLLFLQLSFGRSTKNTNESEAIEFLREYNVKVSQLTNVLAKAEFEYATNMTPENQEKEVPQQFASNIIASTRIFILL